MPLSGVALPTNQGYRGKDYPFAGLTWEVTPSVPQEPHEFIRGSSQIVTFKNKENAHIHNVDDFFVKYAVLVG